MFGSRAARLLFKSYQNDASEIDCKVPDDAPERRWFCNAIDGDISWGAVIENIKAEYGVSSQLEAAYTTLSVHLTNERIDDENVLTIARDVFPDDEIADEEEAREAHLEEREERRLAIELGEYDDGTDRSADAGGWY